MQCHRGVSLPLHVKAEIATSITRSAPSQQPAKAREKNLSSPSIYGNSEKKSDWPLVDHVLNNSLDSNHSDQVNGGHILTCSSDSCVHFHGGICGTT